MYDLVIKGGRVVDPAQGIDTKMDIAVNGNRIALLAEDIPPSQSGNILDAAGKIVVPGLIDIHCHVYAGVHKSSADPDAAGVQQGVTSVVDAGSAGQAIFDGFPRYVAASARTNVFCFLSLSSVGQTLFPVSELRDWSEINVGAMLATIESNRDLIRGIKLRLVGNLVAKEGLEVWEETKKVARQAGLPIMVHLGDNEKIVPPETIRQILDRMEQGDIVSHFFSPRYGGCVFPDGRFYPELLKAMHKGVVLDIAEGRKNLSFVLARKGLDQGIMPTTISTDLTRMSLGGPVYGLTVSMSKFLALGLDLSTVIAMATINPARALGLDGQLGSVKAGMDADLSILEIKGGAWQFGDAEGETVDADRLLEPYCSIKSGLVIEPRPAGRPMLVA